MINWLLRQVLPRHGAILAYHAITDRAHPAAALVHVSADQFREGLGRLQALGRIVPLAELLDRVERGAPTGGLVALTFDDAYESVLRVALPILREHDAPATVFPVSAWVQSAGRFWWDRLEDLAPQVSGAGWAALEDAFDVARGSGVEAIRSRILRSGGRLSKAEDAALSTAEAGVAQPTVMRSAGVDELLALARDPLISIGPHTATHACLRYLPGDEVIAEIRTCREALEAMGVRVEPVLAVPYGVGDERTVPLARAAGMRWSLGVAPRTLRGASSDRPVPRFAMSRKRKGARFEAQLTGGVEALKALLGRTEPDWPRV